MEDQLWEDGAHSIFAPSYSATYLACPGSLLPSLQKPDVGSREAAEGTVFHDLIADWQQFGRPDHRLGEVVIVDGFEVGSVVIDEDMFTYAEECLRRFEDFEGDRFIERRVDISDLTPIPDQGGTVDLAICGSGVFDIIDWKYGKGVQVFAENNTQLLLYACGFFQEFDSGFQTIRMWIAQPRFNHFDCWQITRDELLDWAIWAEDRMALAWDRNAERTPGVKQCQWCRVRVDCVALERDRQALADLSFDALDTPIGDAGMKAVVAFGSPPMPPLAEATVLPTAQLARILGYRRLMESWFKDIQEELTTRALNGETVEGWKVVEGRSRRRWADEGRAAEKLMTLGIDQDDIFPKIVSPNAAEKLLRAVGLKGKPMLAWLRLLVERPAGKPTLARITDSRGQVENIIDDTFEVDESA